MYKAKLRSGLSQCDDCSRLTVSRQITGGEIQAQRQVESDDGEDAFNGYVTASEASARWRKARWRLELVVHGCSPGTALPYDHEL